MRTHYFTDRQLDDITDELIESDANILNILSVLKEDDVVCSTLLKRLGSFEPKR